MADDYYALGGNGAGIDIEERIRSGPFLCLDGETDLDRIMSADWTPLNRSDCALRFTEIFRWSWEGWRRAVGHRIGAIYPHAVAVMNAGAQNNG